MTTTKKNNKPTLSILEKLEVQILMEQVGRETNVDNIPHLRDEINGYGFNITTNDLLTYTIAQQTTWDEWGYIYPMHILDQLDPDFRLEMLEKLRMCNEQARERELIK